MKQTLISYNPSTKTVKIDVHSSNIIAGYAYYLLESQGIPTDCKIEFKDKTVIIEKINFKHIYKEVK